MIDSPNRLVTSRLGRSHPEHIIELTLFEITGLLESSGFEIVNLEGMWLCSDENGNNLHNLDDFRGIGDWSVRRRVLDARSRA